MKMINLRRLPIICSIVFFNYLMGVVYAADVQTNMVSYRPAPPAMGDLTLWQMLVAGGVVMIFIGLLSILALSIIAYEFMTLRAEKLAPREFFEDIATKLETAKIDEARELCLNENNILAKIVLAGLDRGERHNGDMSSMREAMEHRARIEVGKLWQNLNYLSDIVAVAPLLGLLGTVLGMIQAFHAVPLQSAGAKVAMLSAGISKAMIATASGLIIAIPVLMAYSYFRGKVQEVTSDIESYSTDLIKVMENA